MENLDFRIAQRAVLGKRITEEQLQECRQIYEACQPLGVDLTLTEVILQKFSSLDEKRIVFLQYLLEELEVMGFVKQVDIYEMGMGDRWQRRLAAMQVHDFPLETLKQCYAMYRDIKERELEISIPHILLWKNGSVDIAEEILPLDDSDLSSLAFVPEISMTQLCKRKWKSQMLSPQASLASIARRIFKRQGIAQTLQDHQELCEKWQLQIPLVHIILGKYKIDPLLLHSLFIALMDSEGNPLALWQQKIFADAGFSSECCDKLRQAQGEIRQFLQESFRISWLKLTPKRERAIDNHLRENLDIGIVARAQEARQKLEEKGLSLSLLKVLFLQQAITHEEIFSVVLQIAFRVSPQKLSQTMEKIARAASERELEEDKELEEEDDDADKDIVVVKKSSSPQEDLARVRRAFAKGYVNEGRIVDSLLLQLALKEQGQERMLLEILRDQLFLDRARYIELQSETIAEDALPAPIAEEKSLHLANFLIDQKLVSRDKVQSCLRLQNILGQLGIERSFKALLVYTKTLTAEEMLQFEQQQVPEIQFLATPPLTSVRRQQRSRRLLSATAVIAFCLSIAAWQFSQLYRDTNPHRTTIPETVVVEDPIPTTEVENWQELLENPPRQREKRTIQAYQKWNDQLVSKKDSEYLEKNWSSQRDLRIQFKKGRVQYVHNKSCALLISAKFVMPPLPSNKQIVVALSVFDSTKTMALANLDKVYTWPCDEKFSASIGPFTRPLPPGHYHLKITFPLQYQTPLVRELLQTGQQHQWWVAFQQKKPAITPFQTREKQQFSTILTQYTNLCHNFQQLLQKERQTLQDNWTNESSQWLQKYQTLSKALTEREKRYLVPVFPRTETALQAHLTQLYQSYLDLDRWVKGLSLVSPAMSKNMAACYLEIEQMQECLEKETSRD